MEPKKKPSGVESPGKVSGGRARGRVGEPDSSPGSASAKPEAEAEPPLLRTAEVLERAGISHQVLYRYVTLGLVEPVRTGAPRPRLFHPSVIDLIRVVQSMTKSGYSLRDLKDIFFKDERVRRIAARKP